MARLHRCDCNKIKRGKKSEDGEDGGKVTQEYEATAGRHSSVAKNTECDTVEANTRQPFDWRSRSGLAVGTVVRLELEVCPKSHTSLPNT